MSSTFIEVFTGRRFYPLAPQSCDVDVRDIAHALSNQCRFSGHTREFYSVAEHCVRVSRLLKDWGEDSGIQLWGLLHDASEAYLVDLPTPLKTHPELGAVYRAAETNVQAAVCRHFGIHTEMPGVVHRADGVLLATEVRDLMPNVRVNWHSLEYLAMKTKIEPMTPLMAKSEFLCLFRELSR